MNGEEEVRFPMPGNTVRQENNDCIKLLKYADVLCTQCLICILFLKVHHCKLFCILTVMENLVARNTI